MADTEDLTHTARTLTAYALNLAKGSLLTDFEIDNVIELSAKVGVDISAYRDQMRAHAAKISGILKELADAKSDCLHWMRAHDELGARPWWRRLLNR